MRKNENLSRVETRGDLTIKINVYYDECPENPRDYCDHDSTMICTHTRYNLGDIQCRGSDEFIDKMVSKIRSVDTEFDDWYSNVYEVVVVKYSELVKKVHEKMDELYIHLPLYLYDHSGITIKTTPFSCKWDSGLVGIIYISKADATKIHGTLTEEKIEEIKTSLVAEVEEYDDYLTGSVYGYEVMYNDVEIDSCWNFYGEKYMKQHIDESLDSWFEQAREAKTELQLEDALTFAGMSL